MIRMQDLESVKQPVDLEVVMPIFQQSKVVIEGNEVSLEAGATVYQAKQSPVSPPIYILDRKKILHSKKRNPVLTTIKDDDVEQTFTQQEKDFILDKLKDTRIEKWDDFKKILFETNYPFIEGSISKYVSIGDNTDPIVSPLWSDIVSNIIIYQGEKDARLSLVNKASIPRGFVMKYQPHSLLVTPSNVGKTYFYDVIGTRVDKTTRNSMLGSVRWTDEKSAGLFDNQYYALTIEQTESQGIENILGFLLSFLEMGKGKVSGAGAEMTVQGACPLIITTNPSSDTFDSPKNMQADSFKTVIITLCKNSYALGRRFGILAFGKYSPVVDTGGYDDIEHKKLVEIYRAMEDRAIPYLEQIWTSKRVREYCALKIYPPELFDEIKKCELLETRSFLMAHYAHSFPHIRGAAINCAIVDYLPLIALSTMTGLPLDPLLDMILQKANDYMVEIRKINLDSIKLALGV